MDNSYLWTYDYNAFDAGKSIMRASERGFGPGNWDFFGPCEEKLIKISEIVLF